MAQGDLRDPVDYGSTVRNNLMKRPGYRPYCGEPACFARIDWDGAQFRCGCGYRTAFTPEFIATYRARWPQGPATPAPTQGAHL